jgi:hypothetical protein
MPRSRKSLCTALVFAIWLQWGGSAHAGTQTASMGPVTATVSWKVVDHRRQDPHVKIVRAGATLVDVPITHPLLDIISPGRLQGNRAVLVQDMDDDGEPEVLVEAYLGGAHCCDITHLWTYANGAYTHTEHDWGNFVPRVGKTLFVSADDWSYVFASYAASLSPVEVLDPDFTDVTAAHPRIVEKDLAKMRGYYDDCECRPALAATIADLHSLGRHDEADQLLAAAKKAGVLHKHGRYDVGPYNAAFERTLDKLLRDGGYLTR